MTMRHIPLFGWLVAAASMVVLSGCASLHGTRHCERSSSVADFLFPKEQRVVEQSMPVLRLPLRVGLAFAPSRDGGHVSEMNHQGMLDKVAVAFRNQGFVDSVQVIPSTYLRRGGSFENLDQLKRMMGIDVVVLLSYDQIQFSSDNLLSLSYWTIVGAYTVHGNKNDTQTMVEAVVYDIESRSLLFRAPGVNQTRRGSTAIHLSENQRRDSVTSMDLAVQDLTRNLAVELEGFRQRVKDGRAQVKVEHRPGYSGMGALDWSFLVGVAGAGLAYGAVTLRRGKAGRV